MTTPSMKSGSDTSLRKTADTIRSNYTSKILMSTLLVNKTSVNTKYRQSLTEKWWLTSDIHLKINKFHNLLRACVLTRFPNFMKMNISVQEKIIHHFETCG